MYSKNKLPKELEEIPTIKKALEVLDGMSFNEEERESYEARLKWLRDEEMALKTAEKRGELRGREEGIKEGIKETARNFLDILDNQTISKKTGLTIEEVENLRKEK
jgi:predicted transposase/invertase (TIGR01784 family)